MRDCSSDRVGLKKIQELIRFITVPDGEYSFVNKGPFINLGVQQELLEELRYAIDCEDACD